MANVWSIGIFAEDEEFDLRKDSPSNLVTLFNARKLRGGKCHVHTYADPFLFVHEESLYLFAEVQEVGKKGYINIWQTNDLKQWKNLGPIIKESFHCSYPFLFHDEGKIYLMPESSEIGKTFLFEFKEFPNLIIRKIQILDGNYADSNIIKKNGIYYLITTNQDTNKLELFLSKDLLSSRWVKHPQSPLTDNKRVNRNGGGFITSNNKLFRIVQNTSSFYGQGIIILEVQLLDNEIYKEVIVNENFKLSEDYSWQKKGRHHLSIVRYKGKSIIAMDGLQSDYLINKVINFVYKFI